MAVTNTDNDSGRHHGQPDAGLTTTEAGGTATFTVVLNTQPTADVTIALSSSDTDRGDGRRRPSLTFTAGQLERPQTVTVTGVDDAVDDGNIAYTIVTAPATSADPVYNGLNAADVAVTNTDNDTAGHHRHADHGLTTTEAGGTATFTVRAEHAAHRRRDHRPVAPATRPRGPSRRPALTFTPANWNIAADGDGHRRG